MKKYDIERWLTAKRCRLCEEIPGSVKPFVRYPVIFNYGIKAQSPATYVNLLPLPLCHHSPADKIFKGRELVGVSVTPVRPRVDSALPSEQCFWEVWCLGCSSASLPVYSDQKPGNEMNMLSTDLAHLHLNSGGRRSVHVWQGASSDLSASKFYFPAFLEDTKEGVTEPRT